MIHIYLFVLCIFAIFTSGMISQEELEFLDLLKEYQELSLPGGVGAESGSGGVNASQAPAVPPPLLLPVEREVEDASDARSAAGVEACGGAPPNSSVTLRLMVRVTSHPVELGVTCVRGCDLVNRPCKMLLSSGQPLRIICYAMLPECMMYGHTDISCGVYFIQRYPEIIGATCKVDYVTSVSICDMYRLEGRMATRQKEIRLMMELLSLRLLGNISMTSMPEGQNLEWTSEHVSWWLTVSGLFAVFLGIVIVKHFRLAYWTPCSWNWFENPSFDLRNSLTGHLRR